MTFMWKLWTKPLLFRFVTLVYLFTLGFLCFYQGDFLPDAPKYFLNIPADKVVHFCMFLPFVLLSFLSMGKKPAKTSELVCSLTILASLGCIVAGLTEIIQGMMPKRVEDINDFYADIAGILLCTILVFILDRTRKESRKK